MRPGVVRAEGLEPPRLSSREPKSRASTSSATPARSAVPARTGAGRARYSMAPSACKSWHRGDGAGPIGAFRGGIRQSRYHPLMPHHTPLIGTLVIAIVLAFLLGAVANRLRISPLVGYLLAGVLVGPFTPGY